MHRRMAESVGSKSFTPKHKPGILRKSASRIAHVPRSDALEDLCFNSGQVANAVTEICPLNPQTQGSVHLNARSVFPAQRVHLLGNARTAGVSWSRAIGCRMTPGTGARPLLA